MSVIGQVLLYIAFGATVLLVAIAANLYATFHYDPHNSYRRWCKRCGQRQELYEVCDGLAWEWRAMGHIADWSCNCHRHV